MSIHCVSAKAYYRFLREKLKYSLPSISTLRRWATTLKLDVGVLDNVLEIMKIKRSSMSTNDSITVISFDEVYISTQICMYLKNLQIIGLRNKVQEMFARGLFDNWKQPIYLDFDQDMTIHILYQAISKLYECGFIVVAMVSDLGSTIRK